MKTLAVFLGLVGFTPAICTGQAPVNADSIAVHSLLVIAGIDKFEYLSGEHPILTMQIVNNTGAPVTVPGATSICPLSFIDETWCRTDSTGCQEFTPLGECWDLGTLTIPPGTTDLYPYAYNDFWPGPGNWIHTLGQVRFWDPWGEPWTGGPSFELMVRFHRSPIVAIQPTEWGSVKRLYR